MITQNIVKSFVAAEAITEFALVSLDGNGKIVICDAATDNKCMGVAQRACSTGETVDVVIFGLTRVISDGAITFATTPLLGANPNGKVQPAASAGEYPVCRVIPNINQASSSDGEQILVLFFGPSIVVA